jgi:hypothetical protein
MLRKLVTSGTKPRLIAQKMKRSIGAIQSRIFLFKKAPKAASSERLLICRFDNSPPWGIRLALACELRNTSDRQVELG